jgi:ubiquinone/menaquinone biosynthesis C-methylase UbiE
VVDDVKELKNFNINSVEEIYACHILEHFTRSEYKNVLTRWYEVLKKDGILKISVPNIEEVINQYNKGTKLKTLMGLIYGGQTYKENFHYIGFDFTTLKEDLEDVGFKEISTWDWRNTEHSHIDDYSQCYLPHMDKINGTLMSLNIIAIK